MFASNVVEYKLEEVKADSSILLIRPPGVSLGADFYVYIDKKEHMFYNFDMENNISFY